jgi:hypothetical protein
MKSVKLETFGEEKLFSVISGKINHPLIPRLPAIHQTTLKTPWRGSTVRVYLIEGNPLTLIDTGVNWIPSFKGLASAVSLLGYEQASAGRALPDQYSVNGLQGPEQIDTGNRVDHKRLHEAVVCRSGKDSGGTAVTIGLSRQDPVGGNSDCFRPCRIDVP